MARHRATGPVEQARLDGGRVLIRTVRHRLANKLAVVVGQAELLADDPRLPPDLHDQATQIVSSAMAAAEVVQRLDENLVRMELDTQVEGPSLLDVKRSTSSQR
jgi:signal transduction histidine kinase